MTPRTAVASLSAAAILVSLLATPAFALGSVNLSRYVIERQLVGSGIVIQDAVESDRIQELCADEDGCTITLRIEASNGVFHGVRVHLFYSNLDQHYWETETATGTDSDGFVATIADVTALPHSCVLEDNEPGTATDDALGFRLLSKEDGDLAMTCTLVIAD